MELQILDNKTKWDEFVRSSPQGNVFCTSGFLDSLGKEYELVGLVDGGAPSICAILIKDAGIPIRAPHPFTMYQSVLFPEAHSAMPFHKRAKREVGLLESFVALLAAQYRRISFCLHHTFADLRGFQWFHYHEPEKGLFKVDLRYTGLIDLSIFPDFESYLQSIRSTRRNEYRRTISSDMVVEESNDLGTLERLHELTFARQGLQRDHDSSLVRQITEAALQRNCGRMLLCRNRDGIACSATVFLHDDRCGYYLIGANDPEHRKSCAGVYLLFENIRWCMSAGLSQVDMVGINSPNRGDFKTSFNARPVPYFVVTWEDPSVASP